MKYRVKFKKGFDVKYISHLDLLRTVNRMLKRSKLSLKYSEGFNPHTILTFLLPLSVGMISKTEIFEIELAKDYSIDEVFNALKECEPLGIKILEVTTDLNPKFKKLHMAEYKIYLDCNKKACDLDKIMKLNEIIIAKKTKKGIKDVDIKPLIINYDLEDENDKISFTLKALAGSSSNLNPDLLLKAFNKYDESLIIDYYTVERTAMFSDEDIIF